ncbi:hypothetical protein [Saccharicrinis fermentans]|uniref:PBP domain-containing protein n=1 Tax=Saccharicrinis fermentans DSM 9555 = JCM 21142 TaxID=869213 RepID=W7XUY3_9BACT|nr:hypothetical protein [Saccharicrinis fermentans]GAF01855.1 hypothetical protein JCM21142_474 [Saccharicrinis fermentans DSM 9555 = JCM 21142]
MKKLTVLFILAVSLMLGNVHAQSYKVIVNNINEIGSISKKELAMVFLKKKKKWENGVMIIPVDQSVRAKVRASFSQDVFNKSVAAIRSYWQRAIFSGMATAPVEKPTDKEIIAFVKNNKGAIGYVSSATSTAGVKTLVIKK